ncbi:MAG TPA: lytic polysaccharide monooxygenase [Umezawaea sp.]|nr:lytic polysaccharide monooxygenase [Umezawaea sp.]
MKARKLGLVAVLASIAVALPMLMTGVAQGHGSAQGPFSRTYNCRWNENPEAPTSGGCKAAIAAGGTQAMYDWHEVNIANAAGNSRSIIPDGKLCSAGRDKYKGLDLPRTDWAATKLTSGANITFQLKATAPHRGTFELFGTKTGWNPSAPLKWSDLDPSFAKVTEPAIANGAYQINVKLPAGKTGRHLIYVIWQRSDSPEAFYSCSDVIY